LFYEKKDIKVAEYWQKAQKKLAKIAENCDPWKRNFRRVSGSVAYMHTNFSFFPKRKKVLLPDLKAF
jgi:hypothetical protein